MFTFKINLWPEDSGVTHDTTNWKILKGADPEDTSLLVVELPSTSGEGINILTTNYLIPQGVDYYITAQRVLSDGSEQVWMIPTPISDSSKVTYNSEIYIHEDIVIDTPMVYVDKSVIMEDLLTIPDVTIRSSKFKSETTTHVSTHWIITNEHNEVIYKSMHDEVNKTEIVVDKSLAKLQEYNIVTIHIIHVGEHNIESSVGKKQLTIFDFPYEITTNLQRVYPYTNLIVNTNDSFKDVKKVELLNPDTNKRIWVKHLSAMETQSFTIPGEVLDSESVYIIVFYSRDKQGNLAEKRKRLETVTTLYDDSLDENFVYKKELVNINNMLVNGTLEPCTTVEIYNKILPVCSGGESVLRKHFPGGTIDDPDGEETLTGVDGLGTNLYIDYNSKNRIFTDSMSGTSPTFRIYNHQPYSNNVESLLTIPRLGETDTVNTSGGIFQYHKDKYIYTPSGVKKFKFLDISTTTITETTITEQEFPTDTILEDMISHTSGTETTLFSTGNNRVGVILINSVSVLQYDIGNNLFERGINIPEDYRNVGLKATQLINGDTILYKIGSSVNGILYYDVSKGEFEELTTASFDSDVVIKLKTGEVILSGTTGDSYNMFT